MARRLVAASQESEEESNDEDSGSAEGEGNGSSTEATETREEESWENNDSTDEDVSRGANAKWDGGIFSSQRRSACFGYLAQYFTVGIIYGGLPSTVYGVFMGYLAVPAYVNATVAMMMTMPWSFKFVFGMVNDTVPIFGQRRRPYMTMGWAFCAVMLTILAYTPLPDPYWCVDEHTGFYIDKIKLANGTEVAAEPCNPDARKSGGVYAALMMLAAVGYVVADVAADGLTVEYAKEEPLEKRGSIQTTAYMTRTIGQACTSIFVGLGLNGKLYNGTFDWSLSFNNIVMGFAIPSALMVPISFFLIKEPKGKASDTCGGYLKMTWELLQNKAFLFVVLYNFLSGAIGNISTTAGVLVKEKWAGVKSLQNQMFSLFGNVLFAGGLWLVKRCFLNSSWRTMIAVTAVFLNLVDMFFSTLTIFDVVRNQYFYLGETVLVEVPSAANFVVSTFVVVEMADDGNEGLVYGLLTTAANLGGPFAQAIANQLFGFFRPALSDEKHYIEDTPEFRKTVFFSFMLSYGFSFASLACLYFLPSQKEEAQRRKLRWPRRKLYGTIAVVLVGVALFYSIFVGVLSMLPSTMCWRLAGGSGDCD